MYINNVVDLLISITRTEKWFPSSNLLTFAAVHNIMIMVLVTAVLVGAPGKLRAYPGAFLFAPLLPSPLSQSGSNLMYSLRYDARLLIIFEYPVKTLSVIAGIAKLII